MKRPYLNAVYTNLMLQRDFEPVKPVNALEIPDIMILQKFHQGIYFIVQLIDGDLLNPAMVEAKFSNDYNFLLENNSNQIIHLIEIFVFDNSPSEDFLAAVRGGLKDHNVAKRYLSCFTVELAGELITRQSGLTLNTDGIEKLLKTYLKESGSDYEVLPDINSMLALRNKEYTIDLKVQKPTLTHALIGITIAVWVFILIYANQYNLKYDQVNIQFGAKVNQLITKGQYWRLISPLFFHAGPFPLHLIVNCYSLYIIGNIIERIFGHRKFALIYFMAGIYGSIASFIFSPYAAVGASGAIFGLLGALLYYGVEEPKIFKKYFGYSVIVTVIINIFITFSIPGIDYYAHLGGLVGGFLTAYAIKINPLPEKRIERYIALLVVFLIAAAAFYYGLSLARNQI